MSGPDVTTRWLGEVDAATVEAVHRVVEAVVEAGGAVGWLEPPGRDEIEGWLSEWSAWARGGRAGLVLAEVGGRVQALGAWRAGRPGPVGHVVELTKVMVHPAARGGGLGRLIVDTLVAASDAAGAEVLVLGVRGNNHGARALYASCGFTIWGILPNGVAVAEHRFDDVRMGRQMRLPLGAVVHGTSAGGIGGSVASATEPDRSDLYSPD